MEEDYLEDIDSEMEMDDTASGGEMYEHYRFEVDKGQSLLRIDKYLTDKIAGISRNRIQDAADAGNILVNRKPSKSNYRVKPLDIITIVLAYMKMTNCSSSTSNRGWWCIPEWAITKVRCSMPSPST